MRPSVRHDKRGFTLVELMVSVVVMGAVMGAIGSAVVLASRALPDDQRPVYQKMNAANLATQIANEVYFAQAVTERTATAITFSVADRDADTSSEIIRYAWSGTPGDPLTRQYNAESPVAFAEIVQDFQVGYNVKTTLEMTAGPEVETPFVWVEHIDIDGAVPELEFLVSTDTWCAQFFYPDPVLFPGPFPPVDPADATGWRFENLYFRVKKSSGPAKGVFAAQIRTVDAGGLPSGTIIAETVFNEVDLNTTWTTKEIIASNAPWLSMTEGLFFVIKQVSQTNVCLALYQNTTVPEGNAYFVQTNDGGASWTAHADHNLTKFMAYATVRTGGPSSSTPVYNLTRAALKLRVGTLPSTGVETEVQLLNAPEVSSP